MVNRIDLTKRKKWIYNINSRTNVKEQEYYLG